MTRPRDVGVQLYAVREALAADLPGTIDRLAGDRLRDVEPFDLLTDPAGLAAAMKAPGCGRSPPMPGRPDRTRLALCEAATSLGIATLIVPWLDPERFASRDAVRAVAASSTTARGGGRPRPPGRLPQPLVRAGERSSTVARPSSGSSTTSTPGWSWSSTRTGRPPVARTSRRCSAGSATGSGSCTSRMVRWSRASRMSPSVTGCCPSGDPGCRDLLSSWRSSSSTRSTATCSRPSPTASPSWTGLAS